MPKIQTCGWKGKVLEIDLSKGKSHVIYPEEAVYHRFIGGKGLAGYFLREHITESWDAPSMPLLFFTGPLVDTKSPTPGRFTVMSRSPLTGTVGDTSVGGKWGPMLKRSGYDGLIIKGKSTTLCGLYINEDSVTFEDASGWKGVTIPLVHAALWERGSSAIVGPAAENGVRFAAVGIDGHYFAGRGGLGLVMAGKNVKYICLQGRQKTSIHNKGELDLAREEILRLSAASPVLKGELGIAEYGTGALYDLIHTRRMMPTRNFRATYFPPAGATNAWHFKQKYNPTKTGCAGCHIACKQVAADKRAIPEYETMAHFTALLENTDSEVVMEANRICNETGMDTISAAATLACYAEIRGGVLEGSRILTLLEDIAYNRGEGKELKEGAFRYARRHGRPEAAITVKKQELPAYDPRGAYGMALAYATSTRGACHLRAYPIAHEILRKPVVTDRFSFSGKARIIKLSEDLNAVVDSLTACKFQFFAASLEEYARAFTGVTGCPCTAQDLLKTGERIYYQERIMNAANGFTADDDDLPSRFFTQPGTGGDGLLIPPLSREDFLHARGSYYRIRGLDARGMPLATKIRELELG